MKRLSVYLFMAMYLSAQLMMTQADFSTDRVFYRFYLLQRLTPAVTLFLTIINEKMLQDMATLEHVCSFQEHQIALFAHPLIQKEIFYICEHHDTKTLIRLVETINQYRYIHDDDYVKEVVMLLLIMYENSITFLAKQTERSLQDSLSAHEQQPTEPPISIATASLDTLLNMLDAACDEFARLYQQNTAPYNYWKPVATLITTLHTWWDCVWHVK